jgi:hypothetical protein
MSTKTFVFNTIFIFMLGLLVIGPVSLSSNMRFFSILYFGLFPFLLLTTWIPRLYFRRMWSFWLLIVVHLITLLFYFGDRPSSINLITLTLSYVSIFYLVSKASDSCADLVIVNTIFKYIGWVLVISFLISPVLTLLHWPSNAPTYFPWEALFSDKRLLILIGQDVGHSSVLWLMAFTAAFAMSGQFGANKRSKLARSLLILALVFGLIETESRLALIFVCILMMAWLSYRKVISKRLYATAILVMPLLYFASIAIPSINERTIELTENLQSSLPGVRISASSDAQGTAAVYSGRFVLNIMLMDAVAEHPWFGIGHSDDRLKFGVNKDGSIAFGEDKVSLTESGLRMLAKYGAIYYLSVLVFVITPIVRSVNGYYSDNIFVISITGMILLSGMGASSFENLYGMSGLFVLILLSFHIMEPHERMRKVSS